MGQLYHLMLEPLYLYVLTGGVPCTSARAMFSSFQGVASTISSVKSLASSERRSCVGCGRTVAYSRILAGLETYEACRVCSQSFCGNCISKAPLLIPHQILHPSYHDQPSVAPWLCHKACRPTAVSYYMMEFREECEKRFKDYVVRYMHGGERQQQFYLLPPPREDTFKRRALRIAQLAEVVGSVTGYNLYVKTLKYAYYGTEFYKLLMEEDLLNALKPIVDNLQTFGVIKSSDHRSWIRVYYLAWKHQLEYKTDPCARSRGREAGVLQERCSVDLLDLVAAHLPSAQFLYAAHLHAPHSGDDMNSWYLSQLVRRQGWTVLIAETHTRRLPDGRKTPAFCLLARCDPASGRKEAALCVRGTQSASDWSINLNEDPAPFAYCAGAGVDAEYLSVVGHVHRGMHEGALGILDEYGLRRHVTDLSSCGYEVTVVGHSLGAGTAILVAAELKNSFCAAMNKERLPHSRMVRAVGFGAPPIVCETLSDSMAADGLVYSVILDDDVVGRFSRSNIARLAEELRGFEAEADDWYRQDVADVQAYMQSCGRSSGPSFSPGSGAEVPTAEAPAAEPEAAAVAVAEGRLVGAPHLPTATATPVTVGKEGADAAVLAVAPPIRLVPAGRIVHLHSSSGAYEAALCDHRLPTLRRLRLLAVNGLEDHKLSSYWAALRSVKFKHHFDSSPEHRIEVGLQTRQSIRREPADGEPKATSSSDPALWELCSVCGLDCTWAHVSHSGATRARVTHHCAVCGCVVCTVCSPAGDVLAGEGVNQSVTLGDWRLALPSRGMMDKVRVCAHCYLDSYGLF